MAHIDPFLQGGGGLAPAGSAINRHRTTKKAAMTGMTLASIGTSAGQYATGTSALAVMAGGASATGFGLVIGGGILTVTSSFFSGKSALKTHRHIKGLRGIRSARHDCWQVDPVTGELAVRDVAQHLLIHNQVLPYLIGKKSSKRLRKGTSVIPGGGLLQGIRAFGKAGYKKLRGTKGKNRTAAASWLTLHFLTHECGLADAIISELYSEPEMNWLRRQDFDTTRDFLMDKFKST